LEVDVEGGMGFASIGASLSLEASMPRKVVRHPGTSLDRPERLVSANLVVEAVVFVLVGDRQTLV
jgi:hypothetical protein